MFYQCPKCKRIWQYTIEKCPDCFLELKDLESNRAKVIGVSKVAIPTIFHQKVPYFVLLLEDEKGNKWARKSIKEYKIEEEFKTKTNGDKNTVAIWRVKYDILQSIEKTIQILGGLNLKKNSKVLILPTLVSPSHPYLRDNTLPEFLGAVLNFLLKEGIKIENIKVAAQSFNEIPVGASAQKSQLLGVCRKFKVLPIDLSERDFIKKQNGDFSFEITTEAFNSDFIINLPILKVGRTSAAENILKLLKKENYLGLKYLYSEDELVKNLLPILPQFLTIADGQVVQKPDKYTVFFGVLLAGLNVLNLDRVFCAVSMVDNLPEILKEIKIEDILILGRKVEEIAFKP